MPGLTIIDTSRCEQEQMLFELRRARYGYLLALHITLLCAAGYTPTQIAAVLLCSRSSVYRAVKAYRAGWLACLADADSTRRASSLTPSLRRSLLALLKHTPAAYGWCRTRWSCATLAAQMQIQRGFQVSADTLRRWLHQLGWVWKRAKLAELFLELLKALDGAYPKGSYQQLYVVVDNFRIHKAKAVAQWLALNPRFELLYLPTYCPKANPIERVFWEVHDKCTRNHRRQQICQLVGDIEQHLEENGPWRYKLSAIYYTVEVTAAVKGLENQQLLQAA